MSNKDKYNKMVNSLQVRAGKLNSQAVALEKQVFKKPVDLDLKPGSEEHFQYMELYLKLLKAFESIVETTRRALVVEKEIKGEDLFEERNIDEVYRMLKTLEPEDLDQIKRAFFSLKLLERTGSDES